jgi:hypothetical protein
MTLEVTTPVIMAGPGGTSPLERLMSQAQRAAALDLIDNLRAESIGPIIVAAPAGDWLPGRPDIIREDDLPGEPFHFGRRLAGIIDRHGLGGVMYFGAGSAPLLDREMARTLAGMLHERCHNAVALTNNRHSSDWVGFTQAQDARATIAEVDRDNSLAWLLETQADYDVRVLSALRPSSSMDIDTPTDLAILALHPQAQPHLTEVLRSDQATPIQRIPLPAVLEVAARPESQLAIIGRVSPLAWQALSKVTHIWIRVFAEERGMVASGRVTRGQARSLLGLMMERAGPDAFFADLASLVNGAIIDSRVLMAHHGRWPDAADRFASDTFDVENVGDLWLRAFTAAAAQAPMPVVLGGHGLVSGGLYALTEILKGRLDTTE